MPSSRQPFRIQNVRKRKRYRTAWRQKVSKTIFDIHLKGYDRLTLFPSWSRVWWSGLEDDQTTRQKYPTKKKLWLLLLIGNLLLRNKTGEKISKLMKRILRGLPACQWYTLVGMSKENADTVWDMFPGSLQKENGSGQHDGSCKVWNRVLSIVMTVWIRIMDFHWWQLQRNNKICRWNDNEERGKHFPKGLSNDDDEDHHSAFQLQEDYFQ